MGDPTVKSINGAAGTVIKSGTGEVTKDPASKATTAKTTEKKPAVTKDVVDKAPPKTAGDTTPDWQTRVANLERQLQAEREANAALGTRVEGLTTRIEESDKANRQAEVDRAKAEREKGWMKKGLTDILMLFLRMFFPIINLISLAIRLFKIIPKLLKGEKIPKEEWYLLLADLAGAAPMIGMLGGPVGFLGGAALGGVISAGIHGAVKVTREDKDDMMGLTKDEPSGLRVGWEKLKNYGSETYAALTGKERPSETREIERSGIDTRPVTPSDVPVS